MEILKHKSNVTKKAQPTYSTEMRAHAGRMAFDYLPRWTPKTLLKRTQRDQKDRGQRADATTAESERTASFGRRNPTANRKADLAGCWPVPGVTPS